MTRLVRVVDILRVVPGSVVQGNKLLISVSELPIIDVELEENQIVKEIGGNEPT